MSKPRKPLPPPKPLEQLSEAEIKAIVQDQVDTSRDPDRYCVYPSVGYLAMQVHECIGYGAMFGVLMEDLLPVVDAMAREEYVTTHTLDGVPVQLVQFLGRPYRRQLEYLAFLDISQYDVRFFVCTLGVNGRWYGPWSPEALDIGGKMPVGGRCGDEFSYAVEEFLKEV